MIGAIYLLSYSTIQIEKSTLMLQLMTSNYNRILTGQSGKLQPNSVQSTPVKCHRREEELRLWFLSIRSRVILWCIVWLYIHIKRILQFLEIHRFLYLKQFPLNFKIFRSRWRTLIEPAPTTGRSVKPQISLYVRNASDHCEMLWGHCNIRSKTFPWERGTPEVLYV